MIAGFAYSITLEEIDVDEIKNHTMQNDDIEKDMVKTLANGGELPPIEVEEKSYGLVLRNGNHRVGACKIMKRKCKANVYRRI